VPQATLQIEAGDTYGTLRGVMLECDVEILRAAVPPTRIVSWDHRKLAGVGH